MEDQRMKFIGQSCKYTDEVRVEHDALITAVHGVLEDGSEPWSVNLVFVSKDPNTHDQYGRQIERRSSCPNKVKSGAPGNHFSMS